MVQINSFPRLPQLPSGKPDIAEWNISIFKYEKYIYTQFQSRSIFQPAMLVYRSVLIWLVVSTQLKNLSQIGSFPQGSGWKIKNIWNHHPVMFFPQKKMEPEDKANSGSASTTMLKRSCWTQGPAWSGKRVNHMMRVNTVGDSYSGDKDGCTHYVGLI